MHATTSAAFMSLFPSTSSRNGERWRLLLFSDVCARPFVHCSECKHVNFCCCRAPAHCLRQHFIFAGTSHALHINIFRGPFIRSRIPIRKSHSIAGDLTLLRLWIIVKYVLCSSMLTMYARIVGCVQLAIDVHWSLHRWAEQTKYRANYKRGRRWLREGWTDDEHKTHQKPRYHNNGITRTR